MQGVEQRAVWIGGPVRGSQARAQQTHGLRGPTLGRWLRFAAARPRAMVTALKRTSTRENAMRGAALAFGLFVLVNWTVARLDGGIDSNLLWIDLRSWPWWSRGVYLPVVGLALLGFAVRPRTKLRAMLSALFAATALWAVRDAVVAIGLMAEGRLGGWNVPFSAGVALLFAALARSAWKARHIPRQGHAFFPITTGAALTALLIPLGIMATLGRADYAHFEPPRPGNLAVVFGAGVQGDGKPTLALEDRTLTGIALYHEGRAAHLFFSGGPGPGATHETEAMLALALSRGVPRDAITLDREGLSTWATAAHTAALVRESVPTGDAEPVDETSNTPPRILAVTHAYHLPRVELAFQRHGLDVLTVPATETRPLRRRHYYAARDLAGFWVYWGRRALASVGLG